MKVAVVAVTRGPDVLLLRRGPTAPWKPGWWNFPGGIVDAGETFEDAAYRELREEAGLRGCRLSFACKLQTPEGWWLEAWTVEAPEGWQPTLCSESDAYQWCRIDSPPDRLVEPLTAILAGLRK